MRFVMMIGQMKGQTMNGLGTQMDPGSIRNGRGAQNVYRRAGASRARVNTDRPTINCPNTREHCFAAPDISPKSSRHWRYFRRVQVLHSGRLYCPRGYHERVCLPALPTFPLGKCRVVVAISCHYRTYEAQNATTSLLKSKKGTCAVTGSSKRGNLERLHRPA